ISAVEAEVILDGCYVGGNDADYGGALHLSDSNLSMVNSTLYFNRANNGTALYMAAVSGGVDIEASIRFSTISFNPLPPSATPTEVAVLEVGDPTSMATLSLGQSIFNTLGVPAVGKVGVIANATATAAAGYNYLAPTDEPLFDASNPTNVNS